MRFLKNRAGARLCRGGRVARAGWAIGATILLLLMRFANFAGAQSSQFEFDTAGNMAAQSPESSSLPKVLAQPKDQIVMPGELASFSVVVADTRGVSYQWLFNGAPISGANADSLLLGSVGAGDEGLYSVAISNSSGSITSAAAALKIDSHGGGMPDSWQLTYFGNLDQTPDGDFDGDGVSNLQEFLDGTNPADSSSRFFRLTIFTDGGQVTVTPNRYAFTNGETVTLSATAFAPNTFRGWTGDAVSSNNPITLTMTNNKTIFANLGVSYGIVWTNPAGGDWYVASNWSPNIVPTATDDVFITNQVTVTLNQSAECAGLTFGGTAGSPTLTGTAPLTIHAAVLWVGGTMAGSGRTLVDAGATLNVAPAVAVSLVDRTLENAGTVLWTAGQIYAQSAVLTNRAGALFEAQGNESIGLGTGLSRFDNAGTLRKSVGSGTTTVSGSMSFNNYGTADLQKGTLVLAGGGSNTGGYAVAAGTTLNLSGGTHTASVGSSITGAGGFTVSGGTVTLGGLVNLAGTNLFVGGTATLTGNYICTNNALIISGGTANLNALGAVAPTLLNLSSGTLGGTQPVTIGQVMNWTGGTMSGTGRTVIETGASLNLANAGVASLTDRTLENGGTVLWTGNDIYVHTGVLTNRPGALFETRGAGSFNFATAPSRLDNAGTFRKSVNTGTTTLSPGMSFNNYGTVDLQTGTLALAGGGLNVEAYAVAVGTTLNLSGGTHTASAGSSITGAGGLTVSGGAATLGGLVNLAGTNLFGGGTASLTGNYICTNNSLIISGCTANLNALGAVAPTLLNLSSGTLGGTQPVTISQVMNWTGGTMSGSGRTVIETGANLNVANAGVASLTDRTLENGGTVLWTGNDIYVHTGVLTNRPGALFETRGAGSFNFATAPSRLDNAGTFRKSVNPGTTTLSAGLSFNNFGNLQIQNGLLLANGGYVSSSNALLECSVAGTNATAYGRLQVAGAVTLRGTLVVDFLNGFIPGTNSSFTVLQAGSLNGAFSGFLYPSNFVSMQLSNTLNSVLVRTVGVLLDSSPVMLNPQIQGSNIVLLWPAAPGHTYELEFTSDLSVPNWVVLPGGVLTSNNTAFQLEPLSTSNRFYRVRVAQ